MKNTDKLIYWISTGLFCAFMLASVGMYFFKYNMVAETFGKLGYPSYLIYPLAIAKLLGVIVILSGKFKLLKEWAYAGFFFDFIFALAAHMNKDDGEFIPALVAIILVVISYVYDKKMNYKPVQ